MHTFEDVFMQHKESMVLYESTFKAIELLLQDDASWREAMTGLLRYGFYGEQPKSDNPLIQALWVQALPAMKSAKERYERSVINGKKGGRPSQVTIEKIMQLKEQGKTNKEIANICGCSEKTVEGRVTEYKKSLSFSSSAYAEEEKETDSYTETETERFQGFQGYVDDDEI